MPLVASSIPNLVSGVSQQPAPSRLRTSGSVMTNAYPTVVSGLMKRPPTEFVSKLDAGLLNLKDTTAVHAIDRDANEKYILVAGESGIALFDREGNPQTITYPNGTGYLPTGDIWRKLRFVTVADTTFVLNTEKVTQARDIPETRPNPQAKGTVFIKQAVASVAYAIYVGDTLAGTMTTSDNTEAATALEGTAEIARQLAADMGTKGFTARAIGPTVTLDITPGDKLTVSDEFGGRAMTVYTDTVQEFDDLPPSEINGRLVKVEGNLDEAVDTAYWVSFKDGIWSEDVGYEAGREFDPATMPHVLKKMPNGTFEFRQHDWNGRTVGDQESNPDPTFIDSKINGMFLFKGRLGFLSEENVILSASAVFEDYYRTTVVQLLAGDVIDVASATGRVSTLYHAASFSDELVLFSDKQQFRLTSANILSAETVGITNSTAYPCSLYVAPVTVGSSAFFIADGATHTLAREIFIAEGRDTLRGEDIAVQVPAYVPKNVRDITASSTSDVCILLSEDSPSELYVYKWYTSEGQKIQSAWCKWNFEGKQILGTGFLDNYLYIIFKVDGELRMERMLVGPVIDKSYLLDGQFTDADCARVEPADFPVKHYEMPYDMPQGFVVVDNATGSTLPIQLEGPKGSNRFSLPNGDPVKGFTAGVNYEFRYEFSTQYLREETPDGEGAIQDGRLQLRYYSVIYTSTTYFEAHVTDSTGRVRKSVFNGRVLADPDNITDAIPVDTGEFRFPIFAENEAVKVELVSNEPHRCAFGSVEWSAVYRPKAKRV